MKITGKAGSYMAKYLSKESGKIGGNMYDISKSVREYMKSEVEIIETEDYLHSREILEELISTMKNLKVDFLEWHNKDWDKKGVWMRNEVPFIKSLIEEIKNRDISTEEFEVENLDDELNEIF